MSICKVNEMSLEKYMAEVRIELGGAECVSQINGRDATPDLTTSPRGRGRKSKTIGQHCSDFPGIVGAFDHQLARMLRLLACLRLVVGAGRAPKRSGLIHLDGCWSQKREIIVRLSMLHLQAICRQEGRPQLQIDSLITAEAQRRQLRLWPHCLRQPTSHTSHISLA